MALHKKRMCMPFFKESPHIAEAEYRSALVDEGILPTLLVCIMDERRRSLLMRFRGDIRSFLGVPDVEVWQDTEENGGAPCVIRQRLEGRWPKMPSLEGVEILGFESEPSPKGKVRILGRGEYKTNRHVYVPAIATATFNSDVTRIPTAPNRWLRRVPDFAAVEVMQETLNSTQLERLSVDNRTLLEAQIPVIELVLGRRSI